jgi:hypothetical protein
VKLTWIPMCPPSETRHARSVLLDRLNRCKSSSSILCFALLTLALWFGSIRFRYI